MKKILKTLLCALCFLSFTGLQSTFAQGTAGNAVSIVKFKVSDKMGPIPGASILIKGTVKGTVTDIDGNAILEDLPKGSTLVVSCIGYLSQNIDFTGKTQIDVVLEEDAARLEEVVVVGYATQKKVSLSGSVSAVNVAEITESRPIVNISSALSGMAAGVSVTSSSNLPSSNDASIRVRGIGSLNSTSPLVLVDGVEGSYNSVSPQDVESISVLKDAASAAIYGSRAANGVILITTKKGGRGKVKVDYNGYVSIESVREAMHPVSDYAKYMQYMNEFYESEGFDRLYSEERIKMWQENNDPQLFPNTNWVTSLFQTAVAQNHTLSVSGGTEKVRTFTSFNFNDNPGIMENSGQKKFSFRSNVEAKPTNWLTLGANISGFYANIDKGASYVDTALSYSKTSTPAFVWRSEDGRYGSSSNYEDSSSTLSHNPLRVLNQHGGYNHKYNARAKFSTTINPFAGFNVTASYTYQYNLHQTKTTPISIDLWNFQTGTVVATSTLENKMSMANTQSSRQLMEAVASYEHKFASDRLDFKAIAGVSQEIYRTEDYTTTRMDLVDESFSVFNGATGEASADGSSSEWAMRSYFGRINLGWDDKYLLEGNLRADGSSRFLGSNKWGYFPSVSGAWRISQEKFMMGGPFSELKLRASYGSLGNNSVGNYEAQTFYEQHNYSFGDQVAIGYAIKDLGNTDLTWETTTVANFGLDFGFFKNRLTGTVEYFDKVTRNILIDLPAPYVHGSTTPPTQNAAQVSNRGFEITLGWQDKVGDFSYKIEGNITHIKNNVDKYKGEGVYTLRGNNEGTLVNYVGEGYPVNAQYLLHVDRIVQTEEDLALVAQMKANNPDCFNTYGEPELGDLLFADIAGAFDEDGNPIPDGIIDENDRMICSDGPNPKFYYGLNLSCSWKGFDFSALIQGSYGIKMFLLEQGYNTPTFNEGYQLNQDLIDKAWKPGMTDATYPRMVYQKDRLNTQYSDQYLEDMSFLKIRNIQLGYTLPKKITKKVKMDRVRFYASLENFITFTKFVALDPEVYGLGYPSIRQAVFGLNITF